MVPFRCDRCRCWLPFVGLPWPPHCVVLHSRHPRLHAVPTPPVPHLPPLHCSPAALFGLAPGWHSHIARASARNRMVHSRWSFVSFQRCGWETFGHRTCVVGRPAHSADVFENAFQSGAPGKRAFSYDSRCSRSVLIGKPTCRRVPFVTENLTYDGVCF